MEINELIENNMKLVNFVIYNKLKYKPQRLEYDDLYQEGYIWLIKSAHSFDSTKGNKFSTYATNNIYLGLRGFIDRQFDKKYSFQGSSLENEVSQGNSYELVTWKDLIEDHELVYDIVVIEDAIKTSKVKNIEYILNLKINGYTLNDIGKKLNLTSTGVNSRIKKFKLELNI